MATIRLFDLVLLALVIAYVPVGAWRGVFREGVLGGGLVVTGALIVFPPIEWLKDAAGSWNDYGRLAVSVACLGIGMSIGIGAGKVVERHADSSRGRLLGAFCGLANGIWVATFLLGSVERNAARTGFGDELSDKELVSPLTAHGEITLLTLSSVVLLLSGLWTAHLVWSRLSSDSRETSRWSPQPDNSLRCRTINLPVAADTGKLEPAGSASSLQLSNTVTVSRRRAARSRELPATRRDRSDSWRTVRPPFTPGRSPEEPPS